MKASAHSSADSLAEFVDELKRLIQKEIENPLSLELLKGQYADGDTILVDADEDNEELVFKKESNLVTVS